jgi:hypothetical protein
MEHSSTTAYDPYDDLQADLRDPAERLGMVEWQVEERRLKKLPEGNERWPTTVSPYKLDTEVRLFQPRRGIDEQLVDTIARAYEEDNVVDRIVVMPMQRGRFMVIDGHHRVEAARKAKVAKVAIEVFKGTTREALLLAFGANSKRKLEMTPNEKKERIAKMVVMGFSTAEILPHAGLSRAAVFATVKTVKSAQQHHPSVDLTEFRWFQIQMMAEGCDPLQSSAQDSEADLRRLTAKLDRASIKPSRKTARLLAEWIVRTVDPEEAEGLAGVIVETVRQALRPPEDPMENLPTFDS